MRKYIFKNRNIRIDPVDCEWDGFGEWTGCSKSCGGGEKTRTRTVKTIAQHGGNPCVGDSTEAQSCNMDLCPGMHNSVGLIKISVYILDYFPSVSYV